MNAKMNSTLFDAVRQGDITAIDGALAAGADVNAKERFSFAIDRTSYDGSHTPLHLAVSLQKVDIALHLLARPEVEVDRADDFAGGTPLMQAARHGLAAVVDRLLARGADPNAEERYDRAIPARYAIRNNQDAVAIRLIEAGSDLGRFGPGLLGDAAWYGCPAVLEELLARGVSPDAPDEVGRSARFMASWGKKQWALDRFGDAKPARFRPADLFAAAALGDAPKVKQILSYGVPLESRREDGANALLIAVEAKRRDTAEALLAERGDPRAADAKGRTALGLARARGDRAMVELIELWSPER